MVFHRILDLETGQDFYPALFYFYTCPIFYILTCAVRFTPQCNLMNKDLLYLIGLTMVPQIGDVHARALLTHFGSARKIFDAKRSELDRLPGIGTVRAEAIRSFKDFGRAEEELKFIEKYKITVLTQRDANYPQRLLHCMDAPVVLYYHGTADLNVSHVISVIGTRSNTSYGRGVTEEIIDTLDIDNLLVVSGLAYGIDSVAHKRALKKNIATVGVLAHGLDTIYPAANKEMAKQMVAHGGLLSDFMSGTGPDKQNFPRRNRIVAGICDAVIVVETGIRGGSMITAELANSYHKDVFAVPGRVGDHKSAGCNYLIMSNRAALVRNGKDIMDLMNWGRSSPAKTVQRVLFPQLSPVETGIVKLLEKGAAHIDEVTAMCTGNTSSVIAAAMLNLELEGIIRSLPGKMYQLV